MALIAKCILDKIESDDGIRISIMSRHTQNDGKTPRSELDGMCDKHYPELAPSPKLIGRWIRREISWDDFVTEYRSQMSAMEPMYIIRGIIARAKEKNVTVLCIEESSRECHRRLLLEICKEISPSLVVIDK